MALLVAAAAVACGGSGTVAGHSPSAAASAPASSSPPVLPGPAAVTGAYGVLVGPQSGAAYTVSLVGTDAKVVASAQGSTPAAVTCAKAAAAVVPLPVSTSNSRVYFMDGQGVVRFLSPSGDTGRATTVPFGAARRSMFSVSPDDQRIAVVVDDFNSTGAGTRLYVEDLNGGGNHVELFTESGAYTLWPIGWHGGTAELVVAKVPACTQGGGFGCCGPQELHVVDPATAVRRFTIGGTDCLIAGPPTPAGAACETTAIDFKVFDWAGNLIRQEISGLDFRSAAYLSPNGQHVAHTDGTTTVLGYSQGTLPMAICGWIDDTHILAGGDAQHQPRVGNVTTGNLVPVAAQGDCGGRIPGGL